MSTTYAAHIITGEATALGDPEVIVMTVDDGTGADTIAAYPLNDDQDPHELLEEHGWRVQGTPDDIQTGYMIVDVEADDLEAIIRHVTFVRDQANIEAGRTETAWRTLIRDGLNDHRNATRIATAASISRSRAYQIRDGKRT